MENYNILEWVEYFEKSKDKVDEKTDFLNSKSTVLYPGRFYVLNYFAKTRDRYNARPVIISMGISKAEPDSFLCIDLSVMPKKVRLQFLDIYFKLYNKEILDNMNRFPSVEDADKQTFMKDFSYANICKALPMLPIKYAIKKYKIENTKKIYSVPFIKAYRIVGDYCDENFYVNGTVGDIQKEFIEKMRKR